MGWLQDMRRTRAEQKGHINPHRLANDVQSIYGGANMSPNEQLVDQDIRGNELRAETGAKTAPMASGQGDPLQKRTQRQLALEYVKSRNPALQKIGMEALQGISFPTPAAAPSLSTAAKMAREAGLTPGTPEYTKFIRDYAFKGGSMYAPKYVTPTEAKNIKWSDKTNESPLVGQNWENIRGKVRIKDDASELKDSASNVIGTIEDALFNPESGIYNGEVWQGKGASGVISGGITGALQDLTQSDPRYKSYSDIRGGTAANVIRAMGEKGALSDKDIERALQLLPNISGFRGMPDLPETSRQKLKFLKLMLRINPDQWGGALDAAEDDGLFDKSRAPRGTVTVDGEEFE